jgi:hypothetical protein
MLSIFLANFLQIDAMFDPLDNWVGPLSTARSGERLNGSRHTGGSTTDGKNAQREKRYTLTHSFH